MNCQRRQKDRGTAVHLAGQEKFILKTTVIELLLEMGCARGFNVPRTCTTRVDFTIRKGWPDWDEIIDKLKEKSVDKT